MTSTPGGWWRVFPSAGFLTRRTHTQCVRRGGVHSLPINADSDYELPISSFLEVFQLPYGLQLRVQFRLVLAARRHRIPLYPGEMPRPKAQWPQYTNNHVFRVGWRAISWEMFGMWMKATPTKTSPIGPDS